MYHAVYIEFPTIKISPILFSEVKTLKSDIIQADILIFTSKNGVKYFSGLLSNYKIEINNTQKFAVIGEKTKQQLQQIGFNADIINPGTTSDDFIKYLKIHPDIKGKNLLYLTGNLAPKKLCISLKNIANVKRLDIYKTDLPKVISAPIAERIKNQKYDYIIFASPSAFDNLQNILKLNPKNNLKNILCIGKTTANHILKSGYTVKAIAQKPDAEGIIKAISKS